MKENNINISLKMNGVTDVADVSCHPLICKIMNVKDGSWSDDEYNVFNSELKRVLSSKFMLIAKSTGIYDFIVEINWLIGMKLNSIDFVDFYFSLKLFTKESILIGDIHHSKFVVKGNDIVNENVLLNAINIIPTKEFIVCYKTLELNDNLPLALKDIPESFQKVSVMSNFKEYKKFIYDTSKVLIFLQEKKLYDYTKIDFFRFEYHLAENKGLSMLFWINDYSDREFSNLRESKIHEINYQNEDELKYLMFQFFTEMNILHPQIIQSENHLSLEDAFALSTYLKY